mgnify:CR=1 FL=1
MKHLLLVLILFVPTVCANKITPDGYARYIVRLACKAQADKVACAAMKGDRKALEDFCFAGRLNACLVILGVYDL